MRRTCTTWLIFTLLAGCSAMAGKGPVVRIKELAQIEGVRSNQLFGYGLVVGLKGTGDKTQTVFTAQSLTNMLDKLGIAPSKVSKFGLSSSGSEVKVKNVAAVLVTAELPPFIQPGARIDVTLSSIGDSESLEGGTLVLTPLQGPDGKIYAVSQGPVSLGGMAESTTTPTHPTVAHIPQGAFVEQKVPVNYLENGQMTLVINEPDFTTVSRIVKRINVDFPGVAMAQNSGSVQLTYPQGFEGGPVAFIADIEQLKVTGDTIGKIVVNERTGTLVMGQNVAISSVAVSHGTLTVSIRPRDESGAIIDETRELENKVHLLSDSVTVGEVARSLNALGATPTDMIAIFQAMRRSGAIKAQLEIM